MLNLTATGGRLCEGLRRRDILRIGSLGALGAGLGLPQLLASGGTSTGGRAKSCIVVFLNGGPAQHSTWDPKPDAPEAVRGAFKPIATSVPGLYFGELMPKLAEMADKLCVLRAVSTRDTGHSSSGYYMLTGRPHTPPNVEGISPGPPNDAPVLGALVNKLSGPRGGLPTSVTLPQRIFNTGGAQWLGQDAGFLGRSVDPWFLNAEFEPRGYRVGEINLPDGLAVERVESRRALSEQIARRLAFLDSNATASALDERTRQAYDLLRSPDARMAFRLEDEPDAVHDRYGRTPIGQGCLFARRLVEAGVRLVQVNWYRGPDEPPTFPVWDTHADETNRLKDVLVPPTDRALSALIADLDGRGLLDETLVVCMAEFGRTPQLIGGGRSHWGAVFSVAMAGGGVRGGHVHGASDQHAAYPKEGRVTPEDLHATILHQLGIDPHREILDNLGRPHPATRGEVIQAVL
jgi:Protein of unknown function (DUF1501)